MMSRDMNYEITNTNCQLRQVHCTLHNWCKNQTLSTRDECDGKDGWSPKTVRLDLFK